jgi:hypothetical protein
MVIEDGSRLVLSPEEVTTALQYSPTDGLPDLVKPVHLTQKISQF